MSRTSVDLSPFAPVELQPLLHGNGQESSRAAVVVDPGGERFEAGVMSRDYRLVSNRSVSEVANEILEQTGLPYSEHKVIFDGKRFKQQFLIEQLQAEVQVGDIVAVMLVAQNSYQGSLKMGISFELLRLICSNGMCVQHILGSLYFRHWGEKDFEAEMRIASESILNIGERLHQIMPRLQDMARKEVTRVDIQRCFRETGLGLTAQAQAFQAIQGDTQWDLYQGITETLTNQSSFSSEDANQRVSQYFISAN